MRRRGVIFIIITLLALLIAVFASGKLSAPDNSQTAAPFAEGQQVSLRGQLVCLPHRDVEPGQQVTLECSIGFQDETGTYYALQDTTDDYSLISSAPMNEPVEVEGTYQASQDTTYEQSGNIEVTAINR